MAWLAPHDAKETGGGWRSGLNNTLKSTASLVRSPSLSFLNPREATSLHSSRHASKMASASPKFRDSAIEIFELLSAILPKFAAAAQYRAEESSGDDDVWMPYHIFYSEVMILNQLQQKLGYILRSQAWAQLQEDCVSQIEGLLGLFESLLADLPELFHQTVWLSFLECWEIS